MNDNKIAVDRVILDNVGVVDTFSDSLKKIVNAPTTPEMLDKMSELDMLFGVKLNNVKDCMNAIMVINALKGSEKAYELVTKMMHEAPEDSPKTLNQNLFVLPDAVELDSIAGMLSDEKSKTTYSDIAGVNK